jgi:hypothetical protein
MPDTERDLRATGESISRDAELVRELEAEKARLDPADPRLAELSERVERVTTGLQHKSAVERALAEETQATD